MAFMTLFSQIIPLFIIAGFGVIFVKARKVDLNFRKRLTDLCFDVLLPCLIISAMNIDFTPEYLHSGGILIVISLVVLIATFIIGYILAKVTNATGALRNIYIYGMMFSNTGFIGYALVESIYGTGAFFYATVYLILIRIAFYSIGVVIMQIGDDAQKKMDWKSALINVPMFAIAISLFLLATGLRLPSFVMSTVDLVGRCVSPVGMMLVGMVLADFSIRDIFADAKIYLITFFRLLVIPIIAIAVLKLFGIVGLVGAVPVMLLSLPVAVTVTFLSDKFNGNTCFAAQFVFISTLFSLATIPVILYITDIVIGR